MDVGLELIHGLHNLPADSRGCVLTIGNFDGVHRGHQALIARTCELARQHGVAPTVLTFEPTPREFFAPNERPGRIASLRDKIDALKSYGIERMVVQRFSRSFSGIDAEAFASLLADKLKAKAVVVGDDFRFGCRRAGDLDVLRAAGQRLGFSAEGLGSVLVDGRRCSSTAVREALAGPDLALAARLLGRPFRMTGRIRHGLRLGRTLNMRTANINLIRRPALRLGIYAVRAVVAGKTWDGVASLGVRPTLGLTRCLLETHLFGDVDKVGDIYGEVMQVQFEHYLRDELKFDSLDALAEQMHRDKAKAMDLLGSQPA